MHIPATVVYIYIYARIKDRRMRGRGDEPHGAENKERMNNGNSCTVTELQNSHPMSMHVKVYDTT